MTPHVQMPPDWAGYAPLREHEGAVAQGDMVVTPQGQVGLLIDLRPWWLRVRNARVQFVNNGPWRGYASWRLRRATEQEVKGAGLWGVGCNGFPRAEGPKRRVKRPPAAPDAQP